MRPGRFSRLAVAFLVLAVAPVVAIAAPKPPHSPDSLSPKHAPAHWLPPEPWVYNHWLPYDERRLYGLLHISRDQLWNQLRDDHRTVAQLAARHGWPDPRRLAAALVAPRRAEVGAARLAQLRDRALRTITQGHLAQHVFFHSLHQFAVPSAAPEIFGVTDAEFRALRRQELSPLAIGRLHGRSPARIEGEAIAVLRERALTGVRGHAITAAQARLLLSRQLTQLPRWLDQARYNGPPLTHLGLLLSKPRDYASNPVMSLNGRFVAYEAYRQKLPLAVKLGEIAVLRADLRRGRNALVSKVAPAGPDGPDPISDYNPAISGDGRLVTYESSSGNQNFAKRYGRIHTLLCHVGTSVTTPVDRPDRGLPDSLSSYNPALAANGSRMIYQAVRGGRTVILARDVRSGRERTVVAGAGATGARFADPYEPGISANGSRVVYTLARGAVSDPRSARSSVYVRDLRSGRPVLVSRANGRHGAAADGFSADPAISADGRFVVFTSTASNLGGGSHLYVRDLARGRTRAIPTGAVLPLGPAISRRGAVVAFTAARGAGAQVMAWSAATGRVTLVSRADRPGDGWSQDPSISGDGRRIAFSSTAKNLDPRHGDDTRAIYVRDLATRTTRLVSDPGAAYQVRG